MRMLVLLVKRHIIPLILDINKSRNNLTWNVKESLQDHFVLLIQILKYPFRRNNLLPTHKQSRAVKGRLVPSLKIGFKVWVMFNHLLNHELGLSKECLLGLIRQTDPIKVEELLWGL